MARLLGLCSMVPDEPIARSVCALLASSHGELEDPIRLCLAKMGPRVAGSCVRDIVKEKGDLGLSRTCMINSPDWTEQFEAQIEKWLADDDSPPDQEAILGRWLQLAGLAGPADEIERFRTALRGLMRRIFGVAPGPEHDAESVDRIYLTIGRGHASSLQKAWFSCMSNEDITDLSEGMGEIFRIIADVEKIDVRVDRKASQRAESAYKPPRNDVIDLLRDAADSASVRILLGLAARDEPRLRASVTDAVGILLSRFGNYIPSDLTDLGRQVVDDLWVFAHPGESLPAEFRGVKEQRARSAFVKGRLSRSRWEATLAIVAKLPRRPQPPDWVFLQHQFGGLMRDLFEARHLLGAETKPGYNIISEDAWEEINAVYCRLKPKKL